VADQILIAILEYANDLIGGILQIGDEVIKRGSIGKHCDRCGDVVDTNRIPLIANVNNHMLAVSWWESYTEGRKRRESDDRLFG
jgi:hypothetical protein